ncbi:MAG TPA: type II toxin-antitoxin system RelE/ParE family toxin, partial [Acidobacteriaceae bacterium]
PEKSLLMQVRWTPRAQTDLNDQIDYIAQDNLQAANRMRKIVYEHTKLLEKTPEIGRTGVVADTRELISPERRTLPFIV